MSTNARAIVAAHPDKALPVVGTPQARYSNEDPIYRAALQAALALGFIEIDAECLARAWHAQSRRTGRFDPDIWPVEAVDFGLRPRGEGASAFASCPPRLGVYAVLPDAQWVGRLAQAGVPTLQLRFKSPDPRAVRREVRAAIEAVKAANQQRNARSLLFINDHWRETLEVLAADASLLDFLGVHLGQEDMDAAAMVEGFDAIRAAGLRLGLSTHGYAEMLRAATLQPSYIAMGAVYPTTLKQMATAPQGPGRLAVYARLLQNAGYPGVAIGGISAAELPVIKATGVGSLAVVRAITAEANPDAAAAQLMEAWDA
ncbi:thiamine-phosphate diphosphorylase [Hylemonella gracilis str. Niagara R]|uniref:Thiamine-phosphate diphosphorylase n=1 Tax=Hylemonella gracilis str. Niagara R TaxID=1458275 RepID=A0A016XIJ5_9BURK|nr:thiamine-phosphate diphosphorylase [Hylemonella gracilis str. Niagara R]